MVIVRQNKAMKNTIFEKAFNVYLRLEDGSEHEIPGVVLAKQFQDELPRGPYHTYVVELHIDDSAVRFE